MSTPIADLVALLLGAGLSADTIKAAVDLAQQHAEAQSSVRGISGGIPVDATAEKRRAYDRERKRLKALSTGNSTGIPPEQENALSSLLPSEPKQEEKQEAKKKEPKQKTNRGSPLPETWAPTETHYRAGAERGSTRSQIDAMAEDMRLWARANENRAVARKSDWDSTFMAWIRRLRVNGHGPPGRQQRKSFADIAMELGDPREQPPDNPEFDLDLTANRA